MVYSASFALNDVGNDSQARLMLILPQQMLFLRMLSVCTMEHTRIAVVRMPDDLNY